MRAHHMDWHLEFAILAVPLLRPPRPVLACRGAAFLPSTAAEALRLNCGAIIRTGWNLTPRSRLTFLAVPHSLYDDGSHDCDAVAPLRDASPPGRGLELAPGQRLAGMRQVRAGLRGVGCVGSHERSGAWVPSAVRARGCRATRGNHRCGCLSSGVRQG